MKQLVLIHGGSTYDTYEQYLNSIRSLEIDFSRYENDKVTWKNHLRSQFGNKLSVVLPQMPNSLNAKYLEWKIWFEKMIPHFSNDIILMGHSLGGIFLVKYLSENEFPLKIRALFLIAAPFNFETKQDPLGDFRWSNDLSLLKSQCNKVFIYHSEDDLVVPVPEAHKYKQLLPEAKITVLQGQGHLNVLEFPEIVQDLTELCG